MKRKNLLLFFFLLFAVSVLPANLTVPKIALKDLSFKIKLDGLPDTLTFVHLYFKAEIENREMF
ncbi:MAG: hypothetical protein K8H86_12070, partial [Ignavibacteriaceae bacterium]|nr:hypothetical protein [Ignavibacteriaceae bacterium]